MFDAFNNFASEITTNPEKSSRAVVASILIIGIVALTLNLGETLAPEYFASSIARPSEGSPATGNGNTAGNTGGISAAAQTCKSNRAAGKADELIKNFTASFSGILPGVGNILKEHTGTVVERKNILILEVMKRYANLKFCLDNYENIHNGSSLAVDNNYIQALGSEKSGDSSGKIFLSALPKENSSAENDLSRTRDYIENIIENAIDAAIKLDGLSEQRTSSASQKTQNQLLFEIVKILLQNNMIAGNSSMMLETIQKMISSLINGTVKDTPSVMTAALTAEERALATYGAPTSEELKKAISTATPSTEAKLSFGLLNLLDDNSIAFYKEKYPIALALEAVTVPGYDIMQPLRAVGEGDLASLTSGIEMPPIPANQKCEPQGECFGF